MLRISRGRGSMLVLLVAAACNAREPAPAGAPPSKGQAASAPSKPALGTSAPNVAVPRGQALYARMCAVCHGANGEGYKADRAPAIGHPDYLASASDELIEQSILKGRRATTMSAWGRERGGPLTVDDARDLVAFMRTWQKGATVVLDDRPPIGDPARGKPIYERECARCHGEGGFGGLHTQLADPVLLADPANGFLRHAITRGRSGTPMAGYAGKLTDQEIDEVIAFLRDASQKRAAELAQHADETQPPLKLGKITLRPGAPAARGFNRHPGTTPVDTVHAELERGARVVLLDARAPSDYLESHIAGAVSVPFYDPERYFHALPRDAWLVGYCSCPHAESQMLAQKLIDHGFSKVTVLDEGIGVWKLRGYATRAGRDP